MEAIPKNRLESLLSLFTEVRAGEANRALLMMLNIFLILTSYLVAKVVREPLILSGGGAEIKSYASVLQMVILLGAVQLFGWLASHLSRQKLINYVTLFFVGCFVVFYLTATTPGPWHGIAYFLWVGVFSLMIIAQFWSFANDIYSPQQGKRLFVLLAFGASAGGVFGPMLASLILDIVGVYNLLLVSAGILLLSLLLTNYIMSAIDAPPAKEERAETKPDEPEMSKEGALKVVLRSKYLLMIALLILLSNFVNSTGDVLSAGLVFVGVTWLSFQIQHFAAVCLALVALWLALAVKIGRENKKMVALSDARPDEG